VSFLFGGDHDNRTVFKIESGCEEEEMTRLNDLKEIAYRAYSNTSFYPEKRRDRILKELEEELEEDLKQLGDNPGNYEQKYINHAQNWLEKKSRCISVMITGPANFPTARNQKANNAEDKAWQEFRNWRNKYFKAVNRVSNLSPEDEMDVAIKKVDRLILLQESMKTANRIIRQKNKTVEEKISEMIKAGLPKNFAVNSMKPDSFGGIGYPSYALTNNNAKIKAAKNKILIMKNRISVKDSFQPILFDGGKITIENDRVCIIHDQKPDREIINKIKSKGFHWSRNYGTWSRKHTAQALYDAKEIIQ
jgi:frataxin-like iron-binding protein CyaY/cytochrome c556